MLTGLKTEVTISDQEISEMPSWIKSRKQECNANMQQEYDFVDTSTFSDMQDLAYNIIKNNAEDNSDEKEPLFFIVIGVAGTGKSYLINAIRYLLQRKCMVTATTGKAAFNIRGVTIHSLLKLPVGQKGNRDLTCQSLHRLQESLNGVDYIIIDEYSMLGQVGFGWIDRCCKQATGVFSQVLGGKSLILTGDPGQLPPVADKPLYHAFPSNAIGEQGFQAYQMFDKVVKLLVNQRVHGENAEQETFRQLLSRLRVGESSISDWELLLTQQPINVDLSSFCDATHLFYSNKKVESYNDDQLTNLNQPIASINACHSSATAKKMAPEDMSGLQPVLRLAKGAKVMLTMNLWPDVSLCNGSTGTLIDFIYQVNQQPPDLPVSVIVQFDNYTGPSVNNTVPCCVPICPATATVQLHDGIHERQQLPLKLAYALTIHKSQGLTLDKAWIDLGKSEKCPGISYVALSRVRSLSSCVIEPMTYERLTSIRSLQSLHYRLQEEQRLDSLANATSLAFNQA